MASNTSAMRGSSGSTLVGSIGALVLYVAAASARVCQASSDTCDTTSTPAPTTSRGSAGNTARCAQTGIPWRWASVTIAATRSAGRSAYTLIALAWVPRASAVAMTRSVSSVIACIQGTRPGVSPWETCQVRGIVEEARARHQGGVVDVGAGDLTDQAGASEVADLPEVVGHVADRRDAAVDHLAQPRLRLDAVRRGGEVLVGVDQSGDDEPAGEVDDLGSLGDGEPSGRRRRRRCGLRRSRATGRPTAPHPSRRRSSRRGRRPQPSPLLACHASHATEHLSRP